MNHPNYKMLIKKNQWESLSMKEDSIDLIKKKFNESSLVELQNEVFSPTFWNLISSNPKSIDLIKNHLDKVDWKSISKNPNAIDIIKNNLDKVDFSYLSINYNAMDIIENNLNKINWYWLLDNKNAIDLILKNTSKIINSIHEKFKNMNSFDNNYSFVQDLTSNSTYFINLEIYQTIDINPNGYKIFLHVDPEKIEKKRIFLESFCAYMFHPKRIEKKIIEMNENNEDWEDIWQKYYDF
jgi:hypothetical protein